jgi:hypothetical protein
MKIMGGCGWTSFCHNERYVQTSKPLATSTVPGTLSSLVTPATRQITMLRILSATFAFGVLVSGPAVAQSAAPGSQVKTPQRTIHMAQQQAGAAQGAAAVRSGGVFTCLGESRCEVTCGTAKYAGARVAQLTMLVGGVSGLVVYDPAGKVITSLLLGANQTCTFDGMVFSATAQ